MGLNILAEAAKDVSADVRNQGERLYQDDRCVILSQSPLQVEFMIAADDDDDEPDDEKSAPDSLKYNFHLDGDGHITAIVLLSAKKTPKRAAEKAAIRPLSGTPIVTPVFCGTITN